MEITSQAYKDGLTRPVRIPREACIRSFEVRPLLRRSTVLSGREYTMPSTIQRRLTASAGLCLLVAATGAAWAQVAAQSRSGVTGCSEYAHMGPSGFMGPMGHGGWMQGWLLGLLVWVALTLIVLATLWALRSASRGSWHSHGLSERPLTRGEPGAFDATQRALQILNERYAKGEMDKADFEERRNTILTGHPSRG